MFIGFLLWEFLLFELCLWLAPSMCNWMCVLDEVSNMLVSAQMRGLRFQGDTQVVHIPSLFHQHKDGSDCVAIRVIAPSLLRWSLPGVCPLWLYPHFASTKDLCSSLCEHRVLQWSTLGNRISWPLMSDMLNVQRPSYSAHTIVQSQNS